MGGGELYRTHWAIKDVDLFEVLLDNRIIERKHIDLSNWSSTCNPKTSNDETSLLSKLFIVHGRDEIAKIKVEDFVKSLKLEPIILSMQPNAGKTIIEKLEEYSNDGFAIVIYTPCDIATKATNNNHEGGEVTFNHRARQNVIFEHGYLTAKLGRNKVIVLVKGNIELPSDIDGVAYVKMDSKDEWKRNIKKEIESQLNPL